MLVKNLQRTFEPMVDFLRGQTDVRGHRKNFRFVTLMFIACIA